MSFGEFLLPIIIVYLFDIYILERFMARICDYNYYYYYQYLLILQLKRSVYFLEKTKMENNVNKNIDIIKSWTRREVLKDLKFYSILPAMLASSFIITGIVINQTFIIESKDWGKFAIAKSFMIYSILTVATLFFSGFLVDKFTSRKLFSTA